MRFTNEIAAAFHLWAFLFAGLCGIVRGFIGDAVAQVVEGRKPAALDLRRSAVYTTFTCFYGGFVEYFFFTLLYPTWFSASNWRTVLAQICMDNFVVTPLFTVVAELVDIQLLLRHLKLNYEKQQEEEAAQLRASEHAVAGEL